MNKDKVTRDTAGTVVITGASAGVGRALARLYGAKGWRVGLVARGHEGLAATRRDVEDRGGEALVVPADVSEAEALEAAADRVVERWGAIDLWINAAMVTVFAPFDEVTPAEFRRVTEVTYLGQVFGARAALKHMRPRNRGTIVCVGSALAYRGIPLQSAYCGAKFAIRGFVDSLRTELLHDKSRIRLSIVQLPAVNTPQFDWARNKLPKRPQPVPPIFTPEAVASAIVDAARDAPRELWVGGSAVKAIVGDAVAPAMLDRMLSKKAYAGQQSPSEAAEQRADNLFEPVEGNFGARGRFTGRSRSEVRSVQPMHLRLGAVVVGLAALAFAWSKGRA